MPATEQTWRDQKAMHIIFGASTVVMAIATIWMLAVDHNREWKQWQLTNRKKEARMTQARRDFLADQYSTRMASYQGDMRQLRTAPLKSGLVSEFQSLVSGENERLSLGESDFSKLDAAVEAFNGAAEQLSSLREATVAVEGGVEGDQDDQTDTSSSLASLEDDVIRQRSAVMSQFDSYISEANRREKQLVGRRKFVAADRTAAVSELGLMVGGGVGEKEKAVVQERIQGYSDKIAVLTEEIADANAYRTGLEGVVKKIDADLEAVNKENSVLETELARLDEQVYKSTTNPLEWMTRWPVLDALYDGNVRIDQIWLPDITINYNFSQVARFDRCKTCHQSISQTAPGTATEPAYPTFPDEHREVVAELATPESAPESGATLRDVYGLVLADSGIVNYADVTVKYAIPESPAALAGLETGDVLLRVGDVRIYDNATVENLLLSQASWGKPESLTVRRGLDHPFTSHPRLDLYLTDSSPHAEKDFGCTICHDGQGSGTAFPWTSHTPNDFEQLVKWTREFGWFDNHHWIFPMKPARFIESNCLKCHHEKGGLEPSEKFPEPPAEKLVHGWTIVEKYGCFGCHEINGYDGPDRRIGPDVRLEPNYNEVAAQVLRDDGLSPQQRSLAEALVERPEDQSSRLQLMTALKKDAALAAREETAHDAKLTPITHKLADGLKDVEAPGSYRKVGPSLRFLSSKVEFKWLYSWIKQPSNFRPTTRMPQFFGLWEHLQEDKKELEVAQRYEDVEIRALTEFLLQASGDFEYLESPPEVTEQPSAERGKWLFESRGCLACHSHESFPGIAADQGPDLSRVGAKFATEKGALWLYSWIKKPHRYHVRTKMPDLYLEPIQEKDATGKATGKVTDPAADIAVFLMGTPTDWAPDEELKREWSPEEQEALADLAVEWLSSDAIPTERAKKFVAEGIPEALGPKLKADEKLLLKSVFNNRTRIEQLQNFVAKRTITKYGCFGCHDIPGYEDAKPIGAALAEWGRKDTSKLAFENILKFLEGGGHPGAGHGHGGGHHGAGAEYDAHAGHGHLNPGDFDPDTSYYIQSLNSHSRDGFVWQKLRMPRSYDYKTTKNKGYNERLRMPKFPLDPHEREAVITFILGLVNEAPAEKYIYQPDPEQKAIVDGRQVLERFNCGGCHTLRMEQWEFAFEPGQFDSPSEVTDYPFLEKYFSSQEVALSKVTDARGRLFAEIHGQPLMDQESGMPQRVDEDGLQLDPDDDESDPFYLFRLWRDTLIDGEPWLVGIQDLLIPASREDYGPAEGVAHLSWGGDLARYLFPRVIEKAKEINPQVDGTQAWGWLPPPLMDEGHKVQSDWLHGFLMDPTPIRPAAVMRMPNFRMSADEATKLTNYFAAASGAQFPYEYNSRQRDSYLMEQESDRPERMEEALNIVVDGNYCVKCHAVGDFAPAGDPTTYGPNLADVYHRLRPDYVRDWIANPKRILPYTGMPTNIPYKPDADHMGGVAQTLFRGTSIEQVDGLVDLIMNFDRFAKRQTSITPLVEQAAAKNQPQTASVGGGQ